MEINIKLTIFYSKLALLNITQLITKSFGIFYASITYDKKILVKNDLLFFIDDFFKISAFERFIFKIIQDRAPKIDKLLINSILFIYSVVSEMSLVDTFFNYRVIFKRVKSLYTNCKFFLLSYCHFKIEKKDLLLYMNKMLYFYLDVKEFIVENKILDLIIKNLNFFTLNKQRFFFKPLIVDFKTKNFIFNGYVIKKTCYYAGAEMQPKTILKPKILMMKNSLELSINLFFSIFMKKFNKFQKKINKQWIIFYQHLNIIFSYNCSVVISTCSIGDIATQFFTDHNIISIGRVDYSEFFILEFMFNHFKNKVILLGKILNFGHCIYTEEVELNNFKYIFFIGSKANNLKTVLYYSDCTIDKGYLNKIFVLIKFFFKVILSNNCIFPSNFIPEIYLSHTLKNIKGSNNKINLFNHAIGRALEVYVKLKINNQIINTNLLLTFFHLFQKKVCNKRVNFFFNFDFLEFVGISHCDFWEPCYILFNLLKNVLEFLNLLFIIYF